MSTIGILIPRTAHFLSTLAAVTVMILPSIVLTAGSASAQESASLSPPVNHEVGRIEAVITAADAGYRYRGYILTWRSMRIVVAGPLELPRAPGDNLDIVVSRAEVGGHKVLRFVPALHFSNEDEVDRESADSSAGITLGKAEIEEVVSAESDGYRFVGYFVTWHSQRIFVVDPQSAPTRAKGDTLNFRVLRTGLGADQRLSFSL